MPFTAKTPQHAQLYNCARFCYNTVKYDLNDLPKTRESQLILVKRLMAVLKATGVPFTLDKSFVQGVIGIRDASLTEDWNNDLAHLAWLMVHAELSNYFTGFVLENWGVDAYVVHHVPKSAGTSVYELLNRESYFVTFPQRSFHEMCSISGIIGFAQQLHEFEELTTQTRIYVGGHFNLPDMLGRFPDLWRSRGISLARHPAAALSSALRYVWTMVEGGDQAWSAACPSLDAEELKIVREAAANFADATALLAMKKIACVILRCREFRENYEDLLGQYYYNRNV
jgi:hypothetical protein